MLHGFRHLPAYLDRRSQVELLAAVREVLAEAPLFRPSMPRSGKPFSVCMTNCGPLGWVSDKDAGYRYQRHHPQTGRPWPPIPEPLTALWADVADWLGDPEACLVNRYACGTKLGSHVDADEQETCAPVVSVSLGDDAVFHIGGLKRSDPKTRMVLKSGDIVVMGGTARLAYHGVDKILPGTSDLLAEGGRFNLTLRRVTKLKL
jgi:DNA oxidative demethylase